MKSRTRRPTSDASFSCTARRWIACPSTRAASRSRRRYRRPTGTPWSSAAFTASHAGQVDRKSSIVSIIAAGSIGIRWCSATAFMNARTESFHCPPDIRANCSRIGVKSSNSPPIRISRSTEPA